MPLSFIPSLGRRRSNNFFCLIYCCLFGGCFKRKLCTSVCLFQHRSQLSSSHLCKFLKISYYSTHLLYKHLIWNYLQPYFTTYHICFQCDRKNIHQKFHYNSYNQQTLSCTNLHSGLQQFSPRSKEVIIRDNQYLFRHCRWKETTQLMQNRLFRFQCFSSIM